MAHRVEVPFEPPIRRVVWAGGEDVAAAMVYLLCCWKLEDGFMFYTVGCFGQVLAVYTYFSCFRKYVLHTCTAAGPPPLHIIPLAEVETIR